MHVINSRYTNFSKMTSSQDLWGGHAKVWAGLILSDRTNAITVKASMDLIREKIRFVFFSFFFFFFFWRISSSGMKKDFGHFRMNRSECDFSMDYATCPLHGCIGWVRHLWPSGDWEPVFACRESRSKQARDRPRWSVLDSACWARRQILS